MMLILMLNSKGIAAVPRASIIVLAATVDTFGFNPAVIGLVLGVDEPLNMARAAVNVLGNCLAAVVVAKWEGVFVSGGVEIGVDDDRHVEIGDEKEPRKSISI
jgi:proton glutamate symport protein